MGIIEYYQDVFNEYTLYQPVIEAFFLKNYTLKQLYAPGEMLTRKWGAAGKSAVSYVAAGNFKQYLRFPSGKSRFVGFIPTHSVLFDSHAGAVKLGKHLTVNAPVTLYTTSTSVYMQFLRDAGDEIMQHQLSEAYFRRNMNIFPQLMTAEADSYAKVAALLLYAALRIGEPHTENSCSRFMAGSLSAGDIASYYSMHPNTASRCMRILEEKQLILRKPSALIVPDIHALDREIDLPK